MHQMIDKDPASSSSIENQRRNVAYAIPLAWPETKCKQAGAWYDRLMHIFGVSKKGYYTVGHAAIVLVDNSGNCSYYDFGRYHAPHGMGRVRSYVTDHDLQIKTKASFDPDTHSITNMEEILCEMSANPSTHGEGPIYGNTARINYNKAKQLIGQMQKMEFIKYGPFILLGTNCSRFVNKVLKSGCLNPWNRFLLSIPLTLTPTPMWNLKALNSPTIKIVSDVRGARHRQIKKLRKSA